MLVRSCDRVGFFQAINCFGFCVVGICFCSDFLTLSVSSPVFSLSLFSAYSKPYLEAYPKNAKFFEEGTKWYKMGKRKRADAAKHNKIHNEGMQESDLLAEARDRVTEFIENPATLKVLNSVPSSKDGKTAKKNMEQAVKNAKGDLGAYNRNRWGMYMQASLVDENGQDVLCPPVFWKWRKDATSVQRAGESKAAESKGE